MNVDEFLDQGLFAALEEDDDENEEEPEADDDDADEGADDDDEEDDVETAAKAPGLAEEDEGDDDDEEDEADGEDVKAVKSDNRRIKSEIAQHRKTLEDLAQKDPDFFAFLKENDQDLLSFGADDDDDGEEDAGSDDEGSVVPASKAKKPAKRKVADSDEEEDDDEGAEDGEETADGDDDAAADVPERDDAVTLTTALLDQWQRAALERHSLRSIGRLMRAFRAGCHVGEADAEDTEERLSGVLIPSGAVFHKLMVFCFRHMDRVFDEHLGISLPADPTLDTTPAKRVSVESSAQWKKLKPHVKSYLTNALHFLLEVTDSNMASFVLRQMARMLHYVAVFPALGRKLLKAALQLWRGGAAADERTQVHAFLLIRGMALSLPFPFIEMCLKGTYLTYVRSSKVYTIRTLSSLSFMGACIAELYGLDLTASYQHAFVYLRQLALHLRNAITKKSKESHQAVYNWQFVNSLRVWGLVLSAYPSAEELRPLMYPFCQIVTGVIRLVPTTRFFPLRFCCVRFLIELSARADVFIPVSHFLLEVLECAELQKKPKPSTAKPIDLRMLLRVPNSALPTKPFQEAIVMEALELLVEALGSHAYSIGFPELALPAIIALRKWLKNTTIHRFRKSVTQLVDKLERNVEYVVKKREAVDFSPKDLAKAVAFLADAKEKNDAPLAQYLLVERKRIAERRQAMMELYERDRRSGGKDRDADDDDDEDAEDDEDDSAGEDDVEDEEEEEKKKPLAKSRGAKGQKRPSEADPPKQRAGLVPPTKKAKRPMLTNQDDVVEDLDLSDLSD